jgi:hypothetical protein
MNLSGSFSLRLSWYSGSGGPERASSGFQQYRGFFWDLGKHPYCEGAGYRNRVNGIIVKIVPAREAYLT